MAHIVHIDTSLEWRGGQKQLYLLVLGMLGRGRQVTVACPIKSQLWKKLHTHRVNLCAIPDGWSLKTPFILKKIGADLFAAHTSHGHGCAAVLATKLVVHRRVDFIPSGGWKYRRPNAYIAVSKAVAQILHEKGIDNVSVVYDGVEPLTANDKTDDGPTVLAVGALVPHKGHKVLSKAAKFLPDIDIGVAGNGPLRFPFLRYLGFRSDIGALFKQAKVFVHPSVEEGMGQVIVEAMMAKVPVVATDAGGIPEVIQQHGIIVPKGDAQKLAWGIQKALRGEHPCVNDACHWAHENFGVQKMVDQTCKVYDAILKQ